MNEQIQFMANTKDWKAVKKLKIEENTLPIDILDFLASLEISFQKNFEKFLAKATKLEEIDKIIKELAPKKLKTENEFAELLKKLASPSLARKLNEFANNEKNLKVYLKVYVTLKTLKNAGLDIDFSKADLKVNK